MSIETNTFNKNNVKDDNGINKRKIDKEPKKLPKRIRKKEVLLFKISFTIIKRIKSKPKLMSKIRSR